MIISFTHLILPFIRTLYGQGFGNLPLIHKKTVNIRVASQLITACAQREIYSNSQCKLLCDLFLSTLFPALLHPIWGFSDIPNPTLPPVYTHFGYKSHFGNHVQGMENYLCRNTELWTKVKERNLVTCRGNVKVWWIHKNSEVRWGFLNVNLNHS